jgi:hypothetical protein
MARVIREQAVASNDRLTNAEMKSIKPEVPVLIFARVGSQTSFLLGFFDSYLRDADRPESAFQDLDA